MEIAAKETTWCRKRVRHVTLKDLCLREPCRSFRRIANRQITRQLPAQPIRDRGEPWLSIT
jgi:hypothetical protein